MIYLLKHNPDDGCGCCPLSTPWQCLADSDERRNTYETDDEDDGAPSWCPLRHGAVVVAQDEETLSDHLATETWMGDEGDEPS